MIGRRTANRWFRMTHRVAKLVGVSAFIRANARFLITRSVRRPSGSSCGLPHTWGGINQMDCPKRDQLALEYARAQHEWTKLGGSNPTTSHDSATIQVLDKSDRAALDLIDHRKQQGC
jgi:hypothetical protein